MQQCPQPARHGALAARDPVSVSLPLPTHPTPTRRMANDAQLRNWDKRDSLLPILSVLPLFGPAIYLCLRPRAQV